MFGWRKAGEVVTADRRRFGITLEVFGTGLWLNVYFGKRWSAFTRYTANRHTGPEDNAAVVGWFFRGRERRRQTSEFAKGFGRPFRPVPSREEIMRRNREQTLCKPLPSMWAGAEMRPDGGIKLR